MEGEPPECANDRRRDNFTRSGASPRRSADLGRRVATAYAMQAAAEDEADEPRR
jgi:hypothetical protein